MTTPVYADHKCLDCDRITTVADNEPPENQRCIDHWITWLKSGE